MDFFVDANITSGTAAMVQCSARKHLPFDIRQGFTINPQWDASFAGVAHGNQRFEWSTVTAYADPLTYGVQWATGLATKN